MARLPLSARTGLVHFTWVVFLTTMGGCTLFFGSLPEGGQDAGGEIPPREDAGYAKNWEPASTTIDFGDVPVATSVQRTFGLRNISNTTLSLPRGGFPHEIPTADEGKAITANPKNDHLTTVGIFSG